MKSYNNSIEWRSLSIDAKQNPDTGIFHYLVVHNENEGIILQGEVSVKGTLHIARLIAIVRTIKFLQKQAIELPIYTTSKTVMAWVRNKSLKTKANLDENTSLGIEVANTLQFLKQTTYPYQLKFWERGAWGTILAKQILTRQQKKTHLSYLHPSTITPLQNSICVKAFCFGNPGLMEYRAVDFQTQTEIFHRGPFPKSTPPLGEFLAIVLALAYLQKENRLQTTIYSTSKIALSWVYSQKIHTSLKQDFHTIKLFEQIEKGLEWLRKTSSSNFIHFWDETKWGKNPADFNRGKYFSPSLSSKTSKEWQQQLHLLYNQLSDFPVACFEGYFNDNELRLLQKHGYWLEALAEGKILPLRKNHSRFLEVIDGKINPSNDYEEVWVKYQEILVDELQAEQSEIDYVRRI